MKAEKLQCSGVKRKPLRSNDLLPGSSVFQCSWFGVAGETYMVHKARPCKPRESERDIAMAKEVLLGAEFKAVAKEHGISPTACRGAVLRLLRNRNPVVFDLDEGKLHGNYQTPHVEFLREHREAFGFTR